MFGLLVRSMVPVLTLTPSTDVPKPIQGPSNRLSSYCRSYCADRKTGSKRYYRRTCGSIFHPLGRPLWFLQDLEDLLDP